MTHGFPFSKTIGLVGSTGIIGASFLQALQDHNVITFGRHKHHTRHLDLNSAFGTDIFKDIDVLVYAAGLRDEDLQSDNPHARWRCGPGQETLIRAIETAKITSVINISTAHVYGNLTGRITESTPVDPRSHYAKTHLSFEHALQSLGKRQGISIVNVRPNAVYGMDMGFKSLQRPNLIPFLFPRLALMEGTLNVKAPDLSRNFVSANHVAASSLIAIRQCPQGSTIALNPIGACSLSIGHFANLIATQVKALFDIDVGITKADHTTDTKFKYKSDIGQSDTSLPLEAFLEKYLQYLHSCGSVKTTGI